MSAATGPLRSAFWRRRRFLQSLPVLTAVAGCGRDRPSALSVFRVALPLVFESVDPHVSSTTGAFTALSNVYEPLVFSRGQGLRPGLALRWSSPDRVTSVFELRPGARFHSGRPVEARDVVYSYERCRSGTDFDIGYYMGDVAEVKALSRTALQVRTRRPTPALLSKLAHVFVIPEGSEPALERDGTGPYRVTGWEPGRALRLTRHESYWGERPALAEAEFRLGIADSEAERGLESGEYQMALLELARDGGAAASGRYEIHTRSTLYVKYLAFDLVHPATGFVSAPANPFLDRRVREAIHLGLDRARLVRRLSTRGVPANQLVPRDIFGYAPSLSEVEHAPERSRALLREAGLAEGFAATLHTRPILRDTAELVKRELAEVGIELQVEVLADADLFAAQERHALSLWLDRWSCTTGESAELFETALHSRDEARGLGLYNESGYHNPELDAAIEAAIELEVPADRGRALQSLMIRVMEDLPWLPLYSDEEVWGLQRDFEWQPRVDFWLHIQDVRPKG